MFKNLPQTVFITGVGTEIGKTYFLQKLAQHLTSIKQNFNIIKPIASGIEIDDQNSDCAIILKILNQKLTTKNIKKITPYCFKAPISPNMAANLENSPINFEQLVNFCQKNIESSKKNNQNLLIEGAGGLMTPITNNKTFLDLIKALNVPIILITTNQLGSISHTLTYYNYAQSQKIKIHQVILNQVEENQINIQELQKTIQTLIPCASIGTLQKE